MRQSAPRVQSPVTSLAWPRRQVDPLCGDDRTETRLSRIPRVSDSSVGSSDRVTPKCATRRYACHRSSRRCAATATTREFHGGTARFARTNARDGRRRSRLRPLPHREEPVDADARPARAQAARLRRRHPAAPRVVRAHVLHALPDRRGLSRPRSLRAARRSGAAARGVQSGAAERRRCSSSPPASARLAASESATASIGWLRERRRVRNAASDGDARRDVSARRRALALFRGRELRELARDPSADRAWGDRTRACRRNALRRATLAMACQPIASRMDGGRDRHVRDARGETRVPPGGRLRAVSSPACKWSAPSSRALPLTFTWPVVWHRCGEPRDSDRRSVPVMFGIRFTPLTSSPGTGYLLENPSLRNCVSLHGRRPVPGHPHRRGRAHIGAGSGVPGVPRAGAEPDPSLRHLSTMLHFRAPEGTLKECRSTRIQRVA